MINTNNSNSNSTTSNAALGSSIISTLGSGSGINANQLTNQLVDISKAAQAARLTARKTLLETQVSDFGLMRSAISKLETAASTLGNKDSFDAKSLSIPDTQLLSITRLEAKAAAGNYTLKVEEIAQSQSLSSANYTSLSAPVGKGTLTIRLGEWNNANDDFTVDSDKTGATITIDDDNNSLTGLRDAINDADIGINASIVSDGGQFKLLITSKSGATNELEITATEDVGSLGLANFNFNETDTTLNPEQGGADAEIRVNGLLVTRESNFINDVIDGLSFDLFAKSTTETISIGINKDKTVAETAIRDFVTAYNTFLSETENLVGFNTETEEFGSLRRDPLAKNLVQGIRNFLSATVPGLSGGFDRLASLGIRTELDGTLKIIENEGNTSFRSAIDNNFDAVRDLFVPKTSSSTSLIEVTKFSNKSTTGSYAVAITTQPTKGSLTAGAIVSAFPIDTTGKDYTFEVKLDGITSTTITLPTAKTYATGTELAADFQSLINLDSVFTQAKISLTASYDSGTNKLIFTSNAYGADSNVEFTAVGADMADLGIALGAGTAGTNVEGTIDGTAGFGFGNVLLPAIGSKAEGLSMLIQPGASTGTISFSRGFTGGLTGLFDDYLKSSGLIKAREDSLDKDITKVEEDEEALNRRTEAYRARLIAQFSAMEAIVRSLQSSGTFLDGLVDRLPFTAKSE
jgi:flagellar hook-associated protein 2